MCALNQGACTHANRPAVITLAMASIAALAVVRFIRHLKCHVYLRGCVRVALHCYIVAEDDHVNADKSCAGTSNRFNCNAELVGFTWSDTLEEEITVGRVTVTFQEGYDSVGAALIPSLNDLEHLPYVGTRRVTCDQPPDTRKTLLFPGTHYDLMGQNTFLLKKSGCLGFANLQSGNSAAIGNWAEVCVFKSMFLRCCCLVCVRNALLICFTAIVATCTDGLKNQDEEQVDCGGTTCDPCKLCLVHDCQYFVFSPLLCML
jgi:hypothetical protein